MEWLNYHHLLYFWAVVKEGGIVPASKRLNLSHPTISTQIRKLEESLDEPLFDRSGRKLRLTEMGQVVYHYADEIFSLGTELMDTVKGRREGVGVRLRVGVTSILPKLVVLQLLEPVLSLDHPVHLVLTEDRHERLLFDLSAHRLDVVLADAPVPPGSAIKAFNHDLGESPVAFFARPNVAASLKAGFPDSLDGQPMLMPTHGTSLRRSLDRWFDSRGVHPTVVSEFQDSAVLSVFGAKGLGVFAAPAIVADDVVQQLDVAVVGITHEVHERFFAISAERRLKNPAVIAMRESARHRLSEGGEGR